MTVGQAAKAAESSVAILVDEVQYLVEQDLRARLVAFHAIVQRGLPVVWFGAGLPQLAALSGEAKSYAERLLDFPSIGPLTAEAATHGIVRTARTTGLLYLGLAVTGMHGFLYGRAQLQFAGAPDATLTNLVGREGLARLGIALDPALAPGGDAAAADQALYALSNGFWSGGAIFFGLWLIPMGYAVLVSRWMLLALGYLLVVGGVGYTASAFVQVLLPEARVLFEALSVPATIGEFWILGYLIVLGIRTPRTAATPALAKA